MDCSDTVDLVGVRSATLPAAESATSSALANDLQDRAPTLHKAFFEVSVSAGGELESCVHSLHMSTFVRHPSRTPPAATQAPALLSLAGGLSAGFQIPHTSFPHNVSGADNLFAHRPFQTHSQDGNNAHACADDMYALHTHNVHSPSRRRRVTGA